MLKYLRIAVTALSVTVCVVLTVLWVRSYGHFDWLGGLILTPRGKEFQVNYGCLIESANGAVVVVYAGNLRASLMLVATSAGSSPALSSLRVTGDEDESASNGFRAKIYPTGMWRASSPHWFLALITGTAAAVPWIKWRFSLRTLLVAMALVAIVLGMVIYLAR
jgi:hypothetical protein